MDISSSIKASIKVDVYGQANDDTKHIFTYPDAFDPTRITSKYDWLKSISDPRATRVFKASEVYAYWKNVYGNYYAIIVPNRLDPRGGRLMVTLFTGKNVPTDGRKVIEALRELKPLADGNYDRGNVERVVDKFAKCIKPDYFPSKAASTSKDNAFRRYKSEEELAEIFLFTEQAEYAEYRRLLIVPDLHVPAQLTPDYKEITSPIKHTYYIDEMLPQGVNVSKTRLQDGDTLTITYSANGYEPKSISVRIDRKNNHCLRYDGVKIVVNDANTAGITLQRRIKLNFIAESMRLLSRPKASIYCNNQTCTLDRDGYITLPHPIAQGTYKLRIDAYGYGKYERNLEESELQKGQAEIHLIPEEKTVSIRLYVKGEIIKGNVSLKGNDPLYQYLREVENAHRELNKYSFKTIYGEDGKPKTGNNKKGGKKTSKSKRLLYIIISLIILVTLLFLYFDITPWSFNNNNNKIEETDSDVVVNEDDNLNSDSLQMADSLKREHDIYWLKEENVWTKDSLQTQEYKNLCTHITSGQIDSILKDTVLFDFKNTKKYNGYWRQIISNLNKIKDDTEKYDEAVEALIKHSESNGIKLLELNTALKNIATKQHELQHSNNQSRRSQQAKTTTQKENGRKRSH